jgi:hypothetical protein
VQVRDDNGTPANAADDFLPIFDGGDTNANGLLDLNETWRYDATGLAIAGQYRNVATATGTGSLTNVAAPPSQNPDHYFGVQTPPSTPGVSLVKTANKHTVVFGESVTFTYVVKNTGNVLLTNVVVKDDNATPSYPADDFIVGTVASLAPGASATLTATLVPPSNMCNKDPWGRIRKCGLLIIKQHDWRLLKFIYLQAKDHREDHIDGYGWWGGRSYANKLKFRFSDFYGFATQDEKGVSESGDDSQYFNAFSALVDRGLVTKSDGAINPPHVYHKLGWGDDWREDWDRRFGDYFRNRKWDDDRWWDDRDNDRDYDYDKRPEQCATVSTNIAKVTATAGTVTVTATDKETVQVVAPTPSAPYKTFTQGGWGSKPSGSNPGKFLATNFATVYPNGLTIGGTKTIKLTSSYAIEKFLPQGGTPAKLTQNYLNPTWDITVLAGQVAALKLNVDFSAKGLTRPGLGALTVVSGELRGKTVSQVLALANTVLGGGALPSGLTLSELNGVVTMINENFDGGTRNNGYLE